MTENTYPDERDLQRIARWNSVHDMRGLLTFVRRLWTYPDYFEGDPDTGYHFDLATGGWSGNEEIIGALQENLTFWGIAWVSSNRGGRHVFDIPQYVKPRATEPAERTPTTGPDMLEVLSPKLLKWFSLLVDQGAQSIAHQVCGDMSLEADEMWSDEEKAQIETLYEQYNSKGQQEPEWTGQAWPYLYWLAHHLRTWAKAGKALVPMDPDPEATR